MRRALLVTEASSRAGARLRARLAARFDGVLDRRVERRAAAIVERVRRGGDRALLAEVDAHDGWRPARIEELRLAPPPGADAAGALPDGFAEALERTIAAVEAWAQRQRPRGFRATVAGVALEERIEPLARVGLYVPGGRASYPSTAVMTVVPARVAGVREIAVATPAPTYRAQPALRYTLERLGVSEIWGMGGAQAVAAFAFGTESVRRVDLIAGPGNAWMTAAKRQVVGRVAIDGLMGPSEVVIVAAGACDAEWIAADLLAQAEHDPAASALLVTPSRELARAVARAVERRLEGLPTAATARAALAACGGALVVADLDEAVALAEQLAPEHLQLVGGEAAAASERFRRVGALFVGAATPEVLGDYVAGPSHVLPTCGSARFASALGVETFLRRSHRIELADRDGLEPLARAAEALARAEGLPAHAEAARLRRVDAALGARGAA